MKQSAGKACARVAVIGAGWAGLTAALSAAQSGQQVTLFEAARQWGGRARALEVGGTTLDNGQHILIGAYRATLQLMEELGLQPNSLLEGVPLGLPFADGGGLQTPAWAERWPTAPSALAAMLTAPGWTWSERMALVRTALRWRREGFRCEPDRPVAQLCAHLPRAVLRELIEPLCVSALNTPMDQASARVFLRVMRDAMFGPGHGGWNASTLLLPKVHLGQLLPDPAIRRLQSLGSDLRPGYRVMSLQAAAGDHLPGSWRVDGEPFDRVIVATPPGEAARLVEMAVQRPASTPEAADWCATARAIAYQAIATVYARCPQARTVTLRAPMLALRTSATAPAQFVFDKGQLGGPPGWLAFVVSASEGDRDTLQDQVLAQARHQLGLAQVEPLGTVVEKRATFACTPALKRPGPCPAPGLWVAGDYVAGPYPATLEGAVRSGRVAGLADLKAE